MSAAREIDTLLAAYVTTKSTRAYNKLYLATVGVIPDPLAVNPTLTAAALAIRSVDRLLRR